MFIITLAETQDSTLPRSSDPARLSNLLLVSLIVKADSLFKPWWKDS
ncbi:hypothetical protein APA_4891 [Pseudanabaena sp. lw0831]|nr:hypothetical protein APA_4891 [Pseudanabaena sp. lw0831]